MYSKTWKSKQKFFRGDNDRPLTELEKAAVYMLAGATIFLCLIRLYQHFRIALWY
jgi:hypothetical protein